MTQQTPSNEKPAQILIVDDNTTNLGILLELLKKPGRRILAATSGKQALHIASQVIPDLILLDIMMPEMDGFEVLKALQSDATIADIPVIFVSALSQADDIVRGLKAGAVDYVSKPFSADEVDVRVSAQLLIRQHEQNLSREKQQLELLHEQILASMLDGVLVIHADGCVAFANMAALTLIGEKDVSSVLGQQAGAVLGVEDIESCSLKDLSQSKEQKGYLTTSFYHRKHGFFPVECTLQSVKQNEAVLHWVLVFRDISDRLKSESKLRLAHEELLSAHERLEHAQMKLIQAAKMESIGHLSAGVAHEIKNPLAIIQLGADFLADNINEDPVSQEVLTDIREAVRRADKVIKGLLDFSRESEFKTVEIDVQTLLDDALALVSHEIKQRNINLEVVYQEGLPKLPVDKDKLTQVFINLFMNAIQSMGRNGSLSIIASFGVPSPEQLNGIPDSFGIDDRSSVLQIQVCDSGDGILTENVKKLFDPFFTTKPVGQGTGLGLSVSRNIVKLHGGWLTLGNRRDGKGAEALMLFKIC